MSSKRIENRVIIDAFLQKDERILEKFYQEQWPMARHLLIEMGADVHDAKDIMQKSFLTLYHKIQTGTYENRSNALVSTYFQKICRYTMLNHARYAHKKKVQPIDIQKFDLADETSHLNWLDKNQQSDLQLKLDQIGEKCKNLLLAFYWEDRSMKEIATMFELTYESAKNAKYRCLNKLKQLMGPSQK